MMDERKFGALEAQVARLDRDTQEMMEDIKHIRSMLDAAQGSWKTLLAIAGVTSFLSSIVTWVVSNLWRK
jgi:hypothetical protein